MPSLLLAVVLLTLTLGSGLPFGARVTGASFAARVGLALGAGLAYSTLLSIVVSLLHLSAPSIWMLLLLPSVLLLVPAWRTRLALGWTRPTRWDLFLLLACAAVALRTALPRLGYPYPLHIDEFYIMRAGSALARGTNLQSLAVEPHHAAIDGLYGLVLLLTRGDPITTIAPLPAWIAGGTAWIGGALVGRLVGCRVAEAPAALLWLGLQSDGYNLGMELFVGSSVGILLTLALLLAIETGRGDRRHAVGWFGLSLGRFLIHPTTAILSLPIAWGGLRRHARGCLSWTPYGAAAITMGGVILANLLLSSSDGPLAAWIRQLRFGYVAPPGTVSSWHLLVSPPIWLVLSAMGFARLRIARHPGPLGELALILGLAGLTGIIIGSSWTARTERLLYHAQALAIPLAGVGVWSLWERLTPVRGPRRLALGTAGLALIVLGMLHASVRADRPRYWRYFDSGLRNSLRFVVQQTPPGARILALPSDAVLLQTLGCTAFPLAPRANNDGRWKPPWAVEFFGTGSDSLRSSVLRTTRTDFVFSRRALRLDGLDLVAGPNGDSFYHYLYRVTGTLPPPRDGHP